jgi:hypothetical protein
LERLAKAGVLNDIVLIGSWCLEGYKSYFGRKTPLTTLRTRDIDFLEYGEASKGALSRAVEDIANTEVPDDGLVFDLKTLEIEEIRENQDYGGLRVSMIVRLERGGAVDRRHVDELSIGEEPAEVAAVELVRALELAKDVHRSGDRPIGSERNPDAGVRREHDLCSVPVEVDVGTRRPNERCTLGGHEAQIRRDEPDPVDERGLVENDVRPAAVVAR